MGVCEEYSKRAITRSSGELEDMMTVRYEARGFDPQYGINGDGFIDTTWPKLVHAAITVGRRCLRDVLKHGRYSLFEILYRAAMLRANLQRSQGEIRKSDAYHGLDPSEKAAASYFIGLTFANLMARELFDVRWLMHLDVYHKILQPRLRESGRPDLVGKDAKDRWHVIEAKGRSHGLARDVVEKAKKQTSKLGTVCGRVPSFRVASVAHFSRRSLSVRLEDPVGQEMDAINWNFTEDQFLRDYYDPFAALVNQGGRFDERELNPTVSLERVNGIGFVVEDLQDVDLEVGLARRVFEVHRSADDIRDEIHEVTNALAKTRRSHKGMDAPTAQGSSDSEFIGDDGILVRVGPSWFDSGE